MTVLRADHLQKLYNADNFPLRDITFEVDAGSFVAITGPSGSGKSTLLNILGLLDAPTSGTYLVDGVDTACLNAVQIDRLRGEKFGFVFQAAHLVSGRTAAQNVALGLTYAGQDPHVSRDAILHALASVGVESKANTRVELLSGGERQRVAIARALVHGPQILFLDEPTGNLDDENTELILGILDSLTRAGLAVVVVTHDSTVADRAHRHLRMQRGHLVLQRTGAQSPRSRLEPLTSPRREPGRSRRSANLISDAMLSLTSRAARTLLTIAIVAVATAAYIAAQGMTTTASQQVDQSIQTSAGNLVRVSAVSSATRDVDAAAVQALERVEGVHGAAIRYEATNLIAPLSRQFSFDSRRQIDDASVISFVGDPHTVFGIASRPRDALPMILNDDHTASSIAVVGAAIAEDLGYTPGDVGKVLWIGARSISVIGTLSGSGQDAGRTDNAVVLSASTTRSLSSSLDGGMLLARTDPGMANPVAKAAPLAISPEHPEFFTAETTAELSSLRARINDQFQQLIDFSALTLILSAVVAATAAMMNAVHARRSEIGMRRAIGATKSQISWLFLVEGTLAGAVGGGLGTSLGIGVVLLVGLLQRWTPVVSLESLAVGPTLGFAVGALAATLPAWRSARIDPASELRQ